MTSMRRGRFRGRIAAVVMALGAFGADAACAAELAAFAPQIPLSNPTSDFWHQRNFTFEIPDDGFYEIAAQFPAIPSQCVVSLDGTFLMQILRRTDIDPAGPSDYHVDARGAIRSVRYMAKGKHDVTVAGYDGTYPFDKKTVDNFFEKSRYGVTRMSEDAPDQARAVYVPGRADLVFRKGEPLTVRVEQPTKGAAAYSMEVVRQRGDGKIEWTGKVELAGGQKRTAGDISYSCADEGSFEYVVKDAAGKVVDGPWAFVVIDAAPLSIPKAAGNESASKRILVDSVDCAQPDDAAHKFRDNGTSHILQGPSGSYRVTGRSYKYSKFYKMKNPLPGITPLKENESGAAHYDAMDWFAYTLRVKNPGKTHLVVAHVPNDMKRLVSVWGYEHVTGNYNCGLLEAGDAPESSPTTALAFLMWPNGDAIDVMTFCDSHESGAEEFWRQGAIAKIELFELPDGLAALPEASGTWSAGKEFGWAGEQVNLGMEQRMMPGLWPAGEKIPGSVDAFKVCEGPYHDWKALSTVWSRFGELSRWRGDNLLIWPVNSYSMGRLKELEYMERDYESYTRSYRSRIVDPMRRDQFKMMLLLAEKNNVGLVADFQMSRWYDFVLLATDKEKKYTADGLYLTDTQGQILKYPAQVLNPAHPLSRRYLVSWVEEIAKNYGACPAFKGINIRQNGWHTNNSGYFFRHNFGYDDFTVSLFEKETGIAVGIDSKGPERFSLRHEVLMAKHKDAWFAWRNGKVASLRAEMLAALRKHSPNARLYGGCAEYLLDPNSGSGIDPKTLAGQRDMGYGKTVSPAGPHVENGTLDPVVFAKLDVREPISLRRTLDNAWGTRGVDYGQNPCAGAGASIRPHPYQLEPLSKALAAGSIDTVLYGGPWTLPAIDEGIRAWSQAWRAIPDVKFEKFDNKAADKPLVCWQARRGGELLFYLVNTTPYAQKARVALSGKAKQFVNLVSGEKVDGEVTVAPFMVAVCAADGAEAVAGLEVVPDEKRVAAMAAQIAHLEKIAPRTAGITRTLSGKGESYVKINLGQEFYDDGPWGRYDVKTTFENLLAPIREALKVKDYTTVAERLAAMRDEHAWWYQAFGWPEGIYRPEQPRYPYSSARDLVKIVKADGPITIAAADKVIGDALLIPSGKAGLTLKIESAGKWEPRVWMLTGEGYGPVEVTLDGVSVGSLGAGDGKPYFAHFTLPKSLPLMPGFHKISLTAKGAKGLALQAFELNQLPTEPIRKWSAIGLFDMGGTDVQWVRGDFNKEFPPEKEFKPESQYDGMGGAKAVWRQIDIGDDKFIQLLEKYYPYEFTKGNGIAYLATWIKSPDEREATLYYAIDWFGRIWLNDEVVVKDVNGPWRSFASTTVRLRPGWNKLLVKTACGRSSWKANFAVGDPGDLEYSPLPPK